MTRKANILIPISAAAALVCFLSWTAAAEEPYTAADEEYMRKQAEKYYVPDDPLEEYIDPETGEIAWKAVPPELRQHLPKKGKVPGQAASQENRVSDAEIRKRQEIRRGIRSHRAAAAVDWGIPAVTIPRVVVPSAEGTAWGQPQAPKEDYRTAYKVISEGTVIYIALLANRVDLPEGVSGQLTRPVHDSRGAEIFPQAARIFGRYNYSDQAIVWDHVILDGKIVKLENPDEFRTTIHLTERTQPGYKLSVNVRNTVLIKIPIL